MTAVAIKKTPNTVIPLASSFEQLLTKAWVQEKAEDGYTLKPENGVMLLAKQAASCLLQPQLGDQVLMCCVSPGEYFIVAVLQQANPQRQQISVAGDLVLQSQQGSVTLQAKQTLHTQSARWQAMHHDVALTAQRANLVLQRLDASFKNVRYAAQWVTRQINHLIHHGVSETRELSEHYSLSSKIHRQHASDLYLNESKSALNRAKEMGISADKVMINS